MIKHHCDFCGVEFGIPNSTSIWATLETPKTKWEYCLKHEELVDKKLKELKKGLITD